MTMPKAMPFASPILSAATARGLRAGTPAFFSTSRLLRNAVNGQQQAAAASASARRGLLGLFPRRVGWGGALLIFSLGVADGIVSTEWYLSRTAAKKE